MSQVKKFFMKNTRLPLAPTIMFKDYIQKVLIKHDPKQELGPHDDKSSWYNEA